MAEDHKETIASQENFLLSDPKNDFIITSTPNLGSARRKSRRSWFEKPTVAKIDIAIEKKQKRRSKGEDEVETLLLTHFTNPPRIGFGKMKPCDLKRRHLLIKNPHDYPQDVKVEKFPFKKNFDIEETNFTVEPEGTYLLTITWTPEDEGNFREMILFQVDMSYRLQAFVFGAVEKPPQKRKVRKGLLGRNNKNPFAVIQTGALSNIAKSYSPTKEEKRHSAEKVLYEKDHAVKTKGVARGRENTVPVKRPSKEKKTGNATEPKTSNSNRQNSTAIDDASDAKKVMMPPVVSPIKPLIDIEKTVKLTAWKNKTLDSNGICVQKNNAQQMENVPDLDEDKMENVDNAVSHISPERETEVARPAFLSPNSFLQDSLCSQHGDDNLMDLQAEISRQPAHSTVLPTPERMFRPPKMFLSPDTFLKELNDTQEKLNHSASMILDVHVACTIPSPETVLDKSIPHDVMVKQLESVKASLQQERKSGIEMHPSLNLSPVGDAKLCRRDGLSSVNNQNVDGKVRRETFVKGKAKNPFKETASVPSPRRTTFVLKGKSLPVAKSKASGNNPRQDVKSLKSSNSRVKKDPKQIFETEKKDSKEKTTLFAKLKNKLSRGLNEREDSLEMSPICSRKGECIPTVENNSREVGIQSLPTENVQKPVINSATVTKTTPEVQEDNMSNISASKPSAGKRLFSPEVCRSLGIEYPNVSIGSPHQIPDTPVREVLTRRTTLTVTKERPSDALLQATQRSIATCLFSRDVDNSCLKEVELAFDRSAVRPHTTSHVQSDRDTALIPVVTSESIGEESQPGSCPSFPTTPQQLPTSPNPDKSRRSTHVVENPKVVNLSIVNRKRLFPPLDDQALTTAADDSAIMLNVDSSVMHIKSLIPDFSLEDIPTPEKLLMQAEFKDKNKNILQKILPTSGEEEVPDIDQVSVTDDVTMPKFPADCETPLGMEAESESPVGVKIRLTPAPLESGSPEGIKDKTNTESNKRPCPIDDVQVVAETRCEEDAIKRNEGSVSPVNLPPATKNDVTQKSLAIKSLVETAAKSRDAQSNVGFVSSSLHTGKNTAKTLPVHDNKMMSALTKKRHHSASDYRPSRDISSKKTKTSVSNNQLSVSKGKVTKQSKPVTNQSKPVTNQRSGKPAQVLSTTGHPKSVPGLAPSKLLLLKKCKSALPKHPMPFASKNMYYDERWIEKQERGFVHWLNFVLTPSDEYHHSNKKIKVDAGALGIDMKPASIKLAPTKEVLSFRAYAARRRLNQLRRSACKLFQSKDVVHVVQKLESEIESLRLVIRKDKMVHADLGMKQNILDMILSFNPLWLRIGLEAVYGEMIPMQNNNDMIGLSRFIVTRLLGNPDISAEYSHPTVPHLYRDGYAEAIAQHLLKKLFILIYFLDQAKSKRLINHDPCLFCKDSEFKTTKAMLIQFSRDYLSGEGDVTRHLAYFGYVVGINQTAMDEFDYAVSNLAVDLRDGVRLTRVIELLTNNWQLSKSLRAPAISRLQKIHNMDVVFKSLQQEGINLSTEKKVSSRDVVDGHREKTLQLLWALILHYQVNVLLNEEQLKEEIDILQKSLRVRNQLEALQRFEQGLGKKRRESAEPDLHMQNEKLALLLKWTRVVCAFYGIQIENFTVSFGDGRALCALIHHYHPALLQREAIQMHTTMTYHDDLEKNQQNSDLDLNSSDFFSPVPFAVQEDPKLYEQLLANEKSNFKLLYEKISELGGIPLMLRSVDMSNTIPDEKVVVTCICYLCARLLDIRHESRAARVIQLAWRRYYLRQSRKQLHAKQKAAVVIQRAVRVYLAKKSKERQMAAAMKLQAFIRGYLARNMLTKMQKAAYLEQQNRAAKTVQRYVRGFLARRRLSKMKTSIVIMQKMVRGHLLRQAMRKKLAAASCIQRWYRGYQLTKQVSSDYRKLRNATLLLQMATRHWLNKKLVKRHEAARVIQTLWRSHVARKKYLKKKSACIVIQKYRRMCKARQHYLNVKWAALTLQARYRAHLSMRQQRKDFTRLKSAAIVLQKYQRGWLVRKHYRLTLESVILLQTHIRGYIQRQRYKALVSATSCLQKHFTAYLLMKQARVNYLQTHAAVVTIQAWWKMNMERKNFVTKKMAAVSIQSAYRMFAEQKRYRKLCHACLVIQHRYRAKTVGLKQRRRYLVMCGAAIAIQTAWRTHKCRSCFLKQKRAVLTLQSQIKAYFARKNFLLQKQAAVFLQRRLRETLRTREKRHNFLQQKQACVAIQSGVRGMLARKRAKEERAARKIQAFYRGVLVRREFHKFRKSVVTLQSAVRTYLARRFYSQLRRSALMLQCHYRAKVAAQVTRRTFLIQKGAVMTIQSFYRGWIVRKSVVRQHKAAILIQSAYRCHVARSRYKKLKDAAILIQTLRRGVLLTRKMSSEYQEIRTAAVKIQAAYRGHRTRAKYLQSLKAIVYVQSMVRCHQQKQKYEKLRQAAKILQRKCLARKEGKKARREYLVMKGAVLTLQAGYRGYKVRHKLKQMQHAATVIQSAFRCHYAKVTFRKVKQAVVSIQHWYRSVVLAREIRNEFVVKREFAIMIQAFYRGHLARKNYLKQRGAVVLIQALVRGKLQRLSYLRIKQAAVVTQIRFRARLQGMRTRREYLLQVGAAITVQAWFRGMQARKRYKNEKALIIHLQSRVRGKFQRRSYLRLKQATVVIQQRYISKLESKLVRRQFLLTKGAVLTLQAVFRGLQVRKELKKKQEAATVIQSAYRCYSVKENFQKVRNATSTIQSWYRRVLLTRRIQSEYHRIQKTAVVIQKYFRGHRARQAYHRDMACIINLQSRRRGVAQRRRYQRLQWATRVLQSRYRAKIAAKLQACHYQRLRESAITIQAAVRGIQEYKKYQQVKQATKCIQARIRMVRERRAYLRLRNAAIVCQRRWKATKEMRMCMWDFLVKVGASITIQATFRAYKARTAYLKQYRYVVYIQACIRRYLQHKRYREMCHAACVIQQRYRACVASKAQHVVYQKLKHATYVIQNAFRQMKVRQAIHREEAAIVIQKTYRMFSVRQTYLRQRAAAIVLQSCYRGHRARRRRECIYKAVLCIQRALRNRLCYNRLRQQLQNRHEAALKIQRVFRGHQARQQVRRTKAATTIQSVWKMYREQKSYRQTRRSVVILQSLVRGRLARLQVQDMHRKHMAALCLQRAYRAYKQRLLALEEKKKRELHLQKFVNCFRLHLSAITIQRCYRDYRILQQASERLHSILVIQRWIRGRLCLLRRRRFIDALKKVQALSRWYLRRCDAAAVVIQKAVRNWLTKKRCAIREAAAVTLQSLWRGRRVRKQLKSKKIEKVRKNLEEATRAATEDKKLGNRTASALDYLLKYRQLSQILEALIHLDTSTRLSPACCRKLVEVNAVRVLFQLINSCNRSQPHMELIKYSVNILLNLAKYERTVEAVYTVQGSVETLLELMQMYREKGTIFTRTSTLLGILGMHMSEQDRKVVSSDKKLVGKIQSIQTLTARKHKITETRNLRQAKLTAAKSFNCTLPISMPQRHQKRIQPEWVLKRNSLREIENPLLAINFVMNVFQLSPK